MNTPQEKSPKEILSRFPPFDPEFKIGSYSKKDPLSFALASQLAYEKDPGTTEQLVHSWKG